MAEEDFLKRWARRKSQAREGVEPAPAPTAPAAVASVAPSAAATAAVAPSHLTPPGVAPAPVPDPASLEPGADISAFMAKNVDDLLRRKALKTLFSDPRYNVMDRMDVYIDDYSIPDPLPPDWLDKLEQVTHLGDKAGRDRAEAERQAALEAKAEPSAGGPAASEPREMASEPVPQVAEAALGTGEARPEADTRDALPARPKPEPHP